MFNATTFALFHDLGGVILSGFFSCSDAMSTNLNYGFPRVAYTIGITGTI